MNSTTTIPPYSEFGHPHAQRDERLPALKRIFDSVDHSVTRSDTVASQPLSPPELLHNSEEDDEDSVSTPSLSLSPKQGFLSNKDHDLMNRASNKNRSYSHGYVRPIVSFHHRRKSVPHKSPSVIQDALQASLLDKSVVFQLDVQPQASDASKTVIAESVPTHTNSESAYVANQPCSDCGDACDLKCTSKVICGQSLLSALRKRVAYARSLHQYEEPVKAAPRLSRRKRTRTASIIEIPRSAHRRNSTSSDHSAASSNSQAEQIVHTTTTITTAITTTTAATTTNTSLPVQPDSQGQFWGNQQQIPQQVQYNQHIEEDGDYEEDDDQHQQVKRVKKSANASRRQSSAHGSSSGRPSRVKGPCQACQEASDGCMRKAFNWPFPASQIFNDKGKPFVYLCNKCGLRYNKSGGCVCRNCRWVFCKEEKRKALQHIDAMRRNRPDGQVDPNEDIENFVCSPKYWTCGRPWKVGWVLDNLDEEEEESHAAAAATTGATSSPASVHSS